MRLGQDLRRGEGEQLIVVSEGLLVQGCEFGLDVRKNRAVQPVLAEAGKEHGKAVTLPSLRQGNVMQLKIAVEAGVDQGCQVVIGAVFRCGMEERKSGGYLRGNGEIITFVAGVQAGEYIEQTAGSEKCGTVSGAVLLEKLQVMVEILERLWKISPQKGDGSEGPRTLE